MKPKDSAGNNYKVKYKGDEYDIWLSNIDWIKCSMDRTVAIPYLIKKYGVNWVAKDKGITPNQVLKYYTVNGEIRNKQKLNEE